MTFSPFQLATRLAGCQPAPDDPFAATSVPLYQTATFVQKSAEAPGPYDYSRSGNPTRAALESQLAALEGAERALAYGSGMAAVAAVLRTARPERGVLAGSDLYGGSFRYLTQVLPLYGIPVRWTDATDLAAVEAALREPTALLFVETPTNPTLRVLDLESLAALAHRHGALLAVDGSLMTPCRQRPLELGADVVVHSATKGLSGHGDLTAGVVAVRDPELARDLAFLQNAEGTALAPFESWLLLRGLKTLALRLDRQEQSARQVAEFLAGHSAVRQVHYPGLPGHPGHEIHRRQATGDGCLVSFETGSLIQSLRFTQGTRLFPLTVSFGSVTSTASLPGRMSHACIPAELRTRSFPEDLVRLSIGIEDVGDLLTDLERGL